MNNKAGRFDLRESSGNRRWSRTDVASSQNDWLIPTLPLNRDLVPERQRSVWPSGWEEL
jgi:hypothetical protein